MTTTPESLPPRALATYVRVRQHLADARLASIRATSEDHDNV